MPFCVSSKYTKQFMGIAERFFAYNRIEDKKKNEKIEEEEDKVRSKEMKSIPFCSLFYQVDVGNE